MKTRLALKLLEAVMNRMTPSEANGVLLDHPAAEALSVLAAALDDADDEATSTLQLEVGLKAMDEVREWAAPGEYIDIVKRELKRLMPN